MREEWETLAFKSSTNTAPYRINDECTWCAGKMAGTLSSKGYGSCVGMVLFSPVHRLGVVAHFSGSLGNEKFGDQASKDTLEILREVCPVQPGIWKAWVFGGESLKKKTDHITSTLDQTKKLMDTVRTELKKNPYIPCNLLRNSEQFKDPEMCLTPGEPYIGHNAVTLDLETGKVKWD
jgi:hypothetical protein